MKLIYSALAWSRWLNMLRSRVFSARNIAANAPPCAAVLRLLAIHDARMRLSKEVGRIKDLLLVY